MFVTLVTRQDIWDYARNFSKRSNQSAFSNVSSTPMTQRWDRSADAWVQQSAMETGKVALKKASFMVSQYLRIFPSKKKPIFLSECSDDIPIGKWQGRVILQGTVELWGKPGKLHQNFGGNPLSKMHHNASMYIMGIWWVYNQYNQSSLVTTG